MILQHLITFCKVVELQSFGRAAAALNLSQPAVTRHIQGLEDVLGVKVLERRGKVVRVTLYGEIVYRHARRIAEEVDALKNSLARVSPEEELRVYIGTDVSWGCLLELPDVIESFHRSVPGHKLVLHSGPPAQIVRRILHRDADLGIVTSSVSHPDVSTTLLCDDEIVLIAPPDHNLASRPSLTAADLNGQPMLTLRRDFNCRTSFDEMCERHQIRPHIVMELDSLDAVKLMVRAGLGLSFLPKSVVLSELASGTLVQPDLRDVDPPHLPILLVTRREQPLSASQRLFVRILLERINGLQVKPIRKSS